MTQTPRDWQKDMDTCIEEQKTEDLNTQSRWMGCMGPTIASYWLQEAKERGEREQRLKDVVKRAIVMLDEIVPHQFTIQTEMVNLLSTLYPDTPAPTPEITARPIDEWHEDLGCVIWWEFPISEPPHCGTPMDIDWPGYHTHWTPITVPTIPAPKEDSHEV